MRERKLYKARPPPAETDIWGKTRVADPDEVDRDPAFEEKTGSGSSILEKHPDLTF